MVAVGQGEPERTAAVAQRRGHPFPVLCDPERRASEAFGLLEGTPAQVLHDFAWKPNDRRGQALSPLPAPEEIAAGVDEPADAVQASLQR